jgi:hypothetical protein
MCRTKYRPLCEASIPTGCTSTDPERAGGPGRQDGGAGQGAWGGKGEGFFPSFQRPVRYVGRGLEGKHLCSHLGGLECDFRFLDERRPWI